MKTYAAILVATLTAACAVPVEQTTQDPVGSTSPELTGPQAPIRLGEDACEYGTPRLITVDSVTYVEQVPLPCNTGWIDPSDPGPEKAKKDLIDPSPERMELNTSR